MVPLTFIKAINSTLVAILITLAKSLGLQLKHQASTRDLKISIILLGSFAIAIFLLSLRMFAFCSASLHGLILFVFFSHTLEVSELTCLPGFGFSSPAVSVVGSSFQHIAKIDIDMQKVFILVYIHSLSVSDALTQYNRAGFCLISQGIEL